MEVLETRATTIAVGNHVVETTTRVLSRQIQWEDLLEATTLEDSHDSTPPWKERDGYEHELISFDDEHKPDDAYIVRDRGTLKAVWCSPKQVEKWGVRRYAHAHGASKQVAFEEAARNLARTRELIAQWRSNGWYSYVVVCEFGDYSDVIGTGACTDSWEPHFDDLRKEVAANVADQLAKDGFEIVGMPDWEAERKQQKREGVAIRAACNLDFDDVKAYRRWLGKKVSWDGNPASSPAQEKAAC
jgi:hypothetical protein